MFFSSSKKRYIVLGGPLKNTYVAEAVVLFESGYTQRTAAESFDVLRRYQGTGEFTRREGHGRHRMTLQKKDRYLRNIALRNW